MSLERWEAWYTGHVQGVGFRYTTRSVARGYAVDGFVQNLPDGRVHVVVEGQASEVSGFMAEVERQLGHFIREVRKDKLSANGEFAGFEVRH